MTEKLTEEFEEAATKSTTPWQLHKIGKMILDKALVDHPTPSLVHKINFDEKDKKK